jgi:hypothetical protein
VIHSFSLWTILFPLMVAAIVYPFRGRWIAGGISAAMSLLALWLVKVWPQVDFYVLGYRIEVGKTWNLAGVAFDSSSSRNWLMVAYAVLLSVGILALFLNTYRRTLVWSFVWVSVLTALWASVEVRQAAFLLSAAAIVAVFGVAGRPHARGAWRTMLFPSFAYPLVSVAVWYVSQVSLNPENRVPILYASTLVSAAVFASLMIFPFHGAFPAVGEEAEPPAAFVWFLLWPVAVWSVVVKAHRLLPWWSASVWTGWVELSLWGTLLLVIAAGFWQRSQGRTLGYAVLATWVLFLQVGSLGSRGLLLRGAGVAVAAFGITMLREVYERVPFHLKKTWDVLGIVLYLAGLGILCFGIVRFGQQMEAYRLLIEAAALSVFVGGVVSSVAYIRKEGILDFTRFLRGKLPRMLSDRKA